MRPLFFVLCVITAGCHVGMPAEQRKDTPAMATVIDTAYENTGGGTAAVAEARELDDDSLMNVVCSEALTYASRHLQHGDYHHEFESLSDGYTVKTSMDFGHLFDAVKSHLHIRSSDATSRVLDNVYLLENNNFKLIATDTIAFSDFTADSIGDVNGDKLRDYMIVSYASSGCCLRYVYNVYTYDAGTGAFNHQYNFINPDFFPEEKVVRGVGYGHPGQVGLYKLKWNDTVLQAIEHIYRDPENDKQFIRTQEPTAEPSSRNGQVLKAVPEEYRNISGYDWFMYEE